MRTFLIVITTIYFTSLLGFIGVCLWNHTAYDAGMLLIVPLGILIPAWLTQILD